MGPCRGPPTLGQNWGGLLILGLQRFCSPGHLSSGSYCHEQHLWVQCWLAWRCWSQLLVSFFSHVLPHCCCCFSAVMFTSHGAGWVEGLVQDKSCTQREGNPPHFVPSMLLLKVCLYTRLQLGECGVSQCEHPGLTQRVFANQPPLGQCLLCPAPSSCGCFSGSMDEECV